MGRRTIRSLAATFGAIAIAVTGCSAGDDTTNEATTTVVAPAQAIPGTIEATDDADDAGGEPFRIGLVAPSAVSDMAWSQSMHDSLERVAEGREVEIAVSSDLSAVEEAAAALRGYATDGVDLVIAHGVQFGGVVREIAGEFPDVSFAFGTSSDFLGASNVYAYSVEAGQGGYVNGVIAAQLSSSGLLGVIGPVQAGDAELYVDGFVGGVTAQNPDAVVDVIYIDSFSDAVLASEAARAHLSNGADVLTGTSQMVPGAIGVAVPASVPWLGAQSNQTDLAPAAVVASVVYRWDSVLNTMIDQIAAGTLGGEGFVTSFADGGLVMEYNDGFVLDPAVRVAADAAVASIVDGSIVVPAPG